MADNQALSGLTSQTVLSKRDVSPLFEIVAPEISKILPLLMANGASGNFQPAFNHKHEWIELNLTPYRYTITARTGLVATVDNSAGTAVVGTVVEVVTSAGVHTGKQGTISACDATSITLVQYGSTTLTISATDVLEEVSRPRPENSLAENPKYGLGATEYNYTEIFAETFGISGSATQTPMYGNFNTEEMQARQILIRMAQQMTKNLFYGQRIQRVDGSVSGTFGGLRHFLTQAGANVVAGGGAVVTNDMINTMLYTIRDRGGESGAITLIANARHAKNLALLSQANGGVTAMNITNMGAESRFGFGATKFTASTGEVLDIIYDNGFTDTGTIYGVNFNEAALLPLGDRTFSIIEATQPGQDGVSKRLIGEYTLALRNAKQKHGAITGLIV